MKLIPEHRQPTAWFLLAILLTIVGFIALSYTYKPNDRAFPLMVGYTAIPIILLDFLTLTKTKIGQKISVFFSAKTPEQIDQDADTTERSLGKEMVVFLWMILLVLGIYLFGFLPITPVFVFCWMKYRGAYSVRMSLYSAFCTLAFIYILFEIVLQYELYAGILMEIYGS